LKNSCAQPEIIIYPTEEWASLSARYLQAVVSGKSSLNERCAVMLAGGRSAERLMLAWAELSDFAQLNNVDFFFGDERCVPPEHEESNFGLAMRTLFRYGVPKCCIVHRIKADSKDKDSAAERYSELLPGRVSLLLLSVGEDGHIASLFPDSSALHETRKVVPVIGPKPPADRFTITPIVIDKAESIVTLATGEEKIHPFRDALLSTDHVDQCPARLVRHATWLVDFDELVTQCL
jgi:6-phosphogluconolactonase